ncbi:MAG TPA: hypothetical protein VHC69_17800 [Polyangiaceae bacterium]|nr:hypothetical protein [Polyangiaceae bacterium]
MNDRDPGGDGDGGRRRKPVSWALVVTILIVSGLAMLGAIYLVVRTGKL